MSTLTVSGLVSGTAGLELHNPAAGLKVVSVDSGGKRWEFRSATSDFVHGHLRTSGHLLESQSRVVVRITGTSIGNFATRRTAVLAAFDQWVYNFTFTVDGTAMATLTQCGPADVELLGIGGRGGSAGFDRFGLVARQQEYGFTFEHKPK